MYLIIASIGVDNINNAALRVICVPTAYDVGESKYDVNTIVASDKEVIDLVNKGVPVIGVNNSKSNNARQSKILNGAAIQSANRLDQRISNKIPIVRLESVNQFNSGMDKARYESEYHSRTAIAMNQIAEYKWEVLIMQRGEVITIVIDTRDANCRKAAWNLRFVKGDRAGGIVPEIMGLETAVERGMRIDRAMSMGNRKCGSGEESAYQILRRKGLNI